MSLPYGINHFVLNAATRTIIHDRLGSATATRRYAPSTVHAANRGMQTLPVHHYQAQLPALKCGQEDLDLKPQNQPRVSGEYQADAARS